MHQRALEGSEKAPGMNRPDKLTSLNNLAKVLQDQGKHNTAEDMYWRALEESEKALVKDYPHTLTSVD